MAIFNLHQRYVEIAGPAGEPKINVEWVKGHSEEENLYAVGNRMIDALLRTGTPAMESPLPSLLDGEPAPGFARVEPLAAVLPAVGPTHTARRRRNRPGLSPRPPKARTPTSC